MGVLGSVTTPSGGSRSHRAALTGGPWLASLIVVLLLAGAVGVWLNRLSPSARAAVSSIMKVRPVSVSSASARFVPPAEGQCRSPDISLHVVPTFPPDRQGVVSAVVTSTRACRLGGRQSVTPRRSDGRAAAPTVVISDAGGDNRAVTVSPGHGASLEIRFFFETCRIDKNTPVALIATAFSYDLDGARGSFRLPAPVAACPMSANIDSSEVYTRGDVEFAGPATVKAGGRYVGHVDFHYLDTSAAVLDPCPTIWTRISPQSGPELTQAWELECQGMRPVVFGDAIGVDLPLTIPAGLLSQSVDINVGFGLEEPPNPVSPRPASRLLTAGHRISVTGDRPLQPVPFAAVPAPPTPALRRTTSPACDVGGLAPANLHEPSSGASQQVLMSFSLVNVTARPCTLRSATPLRLSAPGRPELAVPVGDTIVAASVDGELAPGATTEVFFSVGSSCDRTAPVVNYTSVNIELPHGVLVVPFPVADHCGVATPGMGVNVDTGSRQDPVNLVEMNAPAGLARGRPTTIQVTLDSFDGADLSQFGYAVTIAGVETRHGFPTNDIQRLLPQLSTVFDIEVDAPSSLPLGPTSVRFEVLTGSVPGAEAPIAVT